MPGKKCIQVYPEEDCIHNLMAINKCIQKPLEGNMYTKKRSRNEYMEVGHLPGLQRV